MPIKIFDPGRKRFHRRHICDYPLYALSRSSSVQRSFFCGDVIAITSWAPDVVNLVRPLTILADTVSLQVKNGQV